MFAIGSICATSGFKAPKALPVYEKIVDRLNVLAQEQSVLCPLSTAIFAELMKQTDPLSRAATANLMEIFSRGICVRNFREAFCEQWKLYSSGQVKSGTRISGSLTKVGHWLSEKVLKRVFWSPETASAWERVAVDLRWSLTVDDYQRLVTLGEIVNEEEPPFLTKWRALPEEQRLKKKSFPDLVRSCRKDIFDSYSTELDASTGTMSANLFIDGMGYGQVPCCEILAGMCAAQVHRGGRVRENDVYDFVHAGAGIPLCRAYFCDGPMDHLLRKKPLEIDIHFDTTIRSRPEDLLAYLDSIP